MQQKANLSESNWSSATLRIFSDALSPDEIIAHTGILPDDMYRIGDRVNGRSNSNTVHKTNAVFFSSGLQKDKPLDEHLSALLTKIEDNCNLDAVSALAIVDIFCGFSSENGQGGITLAPKLLGRLAALKLEVIIDLYPPKAM